MNYEIGSTATEEDAFQIYVRGAEFIFLHSCIGGMVFKLQPRIITGKQTITFMHLTF